MRSRTGRREPVNAAMKLRNILCIGAGFVGGPTMAVMADKCPHLRFTVTDTNAK